MCFNIRKELRLTSPTFVPINSIDLSELSIVVFPRAPNSIIPVGRVTKLM